MRLMVQYSEHKKKSIYVLEWNLVLSLEDQAPNAIEL